MRTALHCVAVVLISFLASPFSLSAEDQTQQPSADDILRRVREHYSSLTDYHFEHQLTAVVEEPGKETERLAKVEFELAVAGAEHFTDDPKAMSFPTGTQRCRMSARSEHNSMVLVANDQEAVLYVPHLKQFKRAPSSMRAIGGPTSATFFLLVHTFPVAMFVDAPLEHPRLVREETLTIADREVTCHVIEAQVKRPSPMQRDAQAGAAGKGEATASLVGSSYLLFLGMHGLSAPKAPVGPPSLAETAGQPLTLLLWVDQREPTQPIVWKSELREPLSAPDSKKSVRTLVISDSYAKVQTKGPLPEDLFRFQIVEGTQEVEKFGQP